MNDNNFLLKNFFEDSKHVILKKSGLQNEMRAPAPQFPLSIESSVRPEDALGIRPGTLSHYVVDQFPKEESLNINL